MMKDMHTVVRLLRNHLYPTYQLYAVMNSRKLAPLEGLKLGALTVLSWLRQRLGAAAGKPCKLRSRKTMPALMWPIWSLCI